MPAVQYPFIDIAVHERVRDHFARGEAIVLFSLDLSEVLWANGPGARLFGKPVLYDLIDDGPNPNDVTFRQVEATGRQLKADGDIRQFLIRIPTGFQRVAVQAVVERIRLTSSVDALLFAAPVAAAPQQTGRIAADMLTGFDDPDTHMAVLGDSGEILAASTGFSAIGLTAATVRTLVDMAGRHSERLVKRPIPTAKGYLPAAIGKVSDVPGMHLLFVVETILGNMGPAHGFPEDAAEPDAPALSEPEAIAEVPVPPVMVSSAPPVAEPTDDGHREEPEASTSRQEAPAPLPVDEAEVLDQPAEEPPMAVSEGQPDAFADIAETQVEEEARLLTPETPADATEDAPHPAEASEEAPASQSVETPAEGAQDADSPSAESAKPDEVFTANTSARPTRFVWKIDAEGYFSEVSPELAAAVGPHAADLGGVAFTDIASLLDLDPDGKIAELLGRRDTWSGKTIYWPIEGTNLKAPVDLAALPTYRRNREFDGFRGFGIVRLSDAIEDPQSIGLTLGTRPMAEDEAPAGEAYHLPAASGETDAGAGSVEPEADEGVDLTPAPDALGAEQGRMAEAGAVTPANDLSQPVIDAGTEPDPLAAEDHAAQGEEARPEPPVFRDTTPAATSSEKIIKLAEHRMRSRDVLTPGEQEALREIARQLEPFRREEPNEADQADEQAPTTAEAAGEIPAPATPVEQPSAAAPPPADADEPHSPALSDTPKEESAEGTATGNHVNEQLEILASSIPARTAMAGGLSAETIDEIPVALLIHAGDTIIHANPEFLALTGYGSIAELEAVGGLDSLLHHRDLEDMPEQSGGLSLVKADDSLVPVTARLQSIRWQDANALMLALIPAGPRAEEKPATVADMPDPDEARMVSRIAELQVEVDELRSILETATDGVVIIGPEGEIRSMNRSASALFDYNDAETRGKPFVMLFAHESHRAVADYLAGMTGHGVASVLNDGREVIGREASGGFIPLFMTIGRLSASNGYCAVIRDITQWKRTEEDLKNAKRAAETANAHKSDFLARVSHEIRTPLNAIIGFSDMMSIEHFGPIGHPRYVEYANDIARSGRLVLDIVNDLLDISKIEAGEMDLEFTAVGLKEAVSEAVSLVQPQAQANRVIIRTAFSESVPDVVADLRSIKQIVLNILANAIRFTQPGGQIVVSTAYESNGSVVLRIRDTGVGMTRAELEQAMKPFRQVTPGTRKRGDGTGLGLPLTKAMVDANRANFAIQSAPNEGTLVEITFPSPRVLAN